MQPETTTADAVLAGSATFVAPVLLPLSSWLGAVPRVADTAHQAFALCQDTARLLVFEYRGPEWLPLCEDLRHVAGPGLTIVAAVPPEHADVRRALAEAGANAALVWEGRPEPVLAAVQHLLRAGAPPVPPAAVPPGPPPVQSPPPLEPGVHLPPDAANAPPPPAAPALAEALGEPVGEGSREIVIDVAPVAGTPPAPDATPFERSLTWPGTVPTAPEAEGLLAGALAGLWPEEKLRGHAARGVAALSALERDALRGKDLPVEARVIVRAAALRFQVLTALASIPEEGPVDGRAVRAILAGIDSTLTDLKRAAEGTPPHLQRALDQLRHDLVKEAIDLTEAAHALAPAETPAIPLPVQAPGASLPKLLSDRRQARTEALVLRRRRRMWVVMVALVVVAAGYHTWRRAARPGSALPPAMSGAPQGMLQVPETPGGMKVLVSESGKPPPPEAVERFRQQEELKGRVVKDTGGGTIVVMPAGAEKGRGQPAAPSPAQRGAP